MKKIDRNRLNKRFEKAENHHLCPECGTKMTEAERADEGNAVFIWYECSRDNCAGQWLQKILRPLSKTPNYRMEFTGDLAAAS